MSVVIDASVIIAVALQETDVALIDAARRTLREEQLLAPPIMPVEIAGAIAMAEWTGRRSTADTDFAWHIASDIAESVALIPTQHAERLFALCRRYRLRGADAAYLSLSIDRATPILTGDKKLAVAAKAAGIDLIYDPNA